MPLVIDKPLGNADSEYRPRTLKALANFDLDQVIILTHDKELDPDLVEHREVASVVDGQHHQKALENRDRSTLPDDNSPFREIYKGGKDDELWNIILGYLQMVEKHLWAKATERSYIRKTIGIQALFDVLRHVAQSAPEKLQTALEETIQSAAKLDFASDFFQASGKGRVRVRNSILLAAGRMTEGDLTDADRQAYLDLMSP